MVGELPQVPDKQVSDPSAPSVPEQFQHNLLRALLLVALTADGIIFAILIGDIILAGPLLLLLVIGMMAAMLTFLLYIGYSRTKFKAPN